MLPITGLACATASLRAKGLVPERRAINKRIREGRVLVPGEEEHEVHSQRDQLLHDGGQSPGAEYAKAMADQKIFIGRVWAAWPTKVRVTVGTQDEMNKFKAAVEKIG